MYQPMKCKNCGKKVIGRSDKLFCHNTCKSDYHNRIARGNRNISQLLALPYPENEIRL